MPKTENNGVVDLPIAAQVAEEAFTRYEDAHSILGDRISMDTVVRWGIGYIANGHVPMLRRRVSIPLVDEEMNVVSILGRATQAEQKPKYINWPPGVKTGNYLYGMHVAADATYDKGFAIVVEGPFDVMAMHLLGYTNTVGILGSRIKTFQAFLIACLAPKAIVIADPDAAGLRGADATTAVLSRYGVHTISTVYHNPDGADIDNLCRTRPGVVAKLLATAGDKIHVSCDA